MNQEATAQKTEENTQMKLKEAQQMITTGLSLFQRGIGNEFSSDWWCN